MPPVPCGRPFFRSLPGYETLAIGRGFATDRAYVIRSYSHQRPTCAPVAQLDRASDFGSEGWGFESLRARQTSECISASVSIDWRTFAQNARVCRLAEC